MEKPTEASRERTNAARKYMKPFNPIRWVQSHVEDLKQIFKMAAAPAMVVALIESNYWVHYFKEFMYIMAILAHAAATPGFPRAKLISINFQLSVFWAISYCWALLGGWCAVQARQHTRQLEIYSPAASTILAIFLMFGTWCSYAGRGAFPKYTLAWITAGIYFVATIPALIELRTMDEVIAVTSLIIECFYVGQAIGVAIGLLIFPRSCRAAFMKSVEDCFLALSVVVKSQPQCIERLVHDIGNSSEGTQHIRHVKDLIGAFTAASTKVQMQVEIAGQEWTYSHLSRSDLKTIADQLTMISAPLVGLKSLADKLLLALTEDYDVNGEASTTEHREFVTTMKASTETLTDAIDGGIKHALGRLGSRSSSSGKADAACLNGSCNHIAAFEKTLFRYRSMKGELNDAAEQYLSQQLFRDESGLDKTLPYGALVGCFLSSHMVLLLSATGYEFYNMLLFLEEASHKPRRLYTPIQNLFSDIRKEFQGIGRGTPSKAFYGIVLSSIAQPKDHDVDHLPPTNFLQRLGNYIRRAWKLFGTDNAGFGVRGALAVMSVAILAFLKDEHPFYNEQRFLWALFSIVLCLDRTAGSSTLKLAFRFFATLLSMIASYVIWYIVDQHVAGIIVFLFLWYCVLSYWQLKSPKYGPAAFTALVAATVMIANQLQVVKIGAKAVAKSGQAVYPSYVLFPLRLAQVTLGILVAYFWTLFPSPLPEHTELRHETGEAMLNLATFNASIYQSVSIQFGVTKAIGPANDHLGRLRSRHRGHLTEHTVLMSKMQTMMKTIPFEFNLGGKFPVAKYREICACITRLGDLFVLVGYISHTLDGSRLAREMNTHDKDVQGHLCPVGIGTRLIILCSALRSGHPLPPTLHVLKVPDLRHFLDRRVATDECFATASLIHSANFMIMRNMNELTKLISDVVGTLDFMLPLEELEEEV